MRNQRGTFISDVDSGEKAKQRRCIIKKAKSKCCSLKNKKANDCEGKFGEKLVNNNDNRIIHFSTIIFTNIRMKNEESEAEIKDL